jgi:hypothetical protein
MKPMFTVVLNESVKLAPSPDLVSAKRLAIEHLKEDPTLASASIFIRLFSRRVFTQSGTTLRKSYGVSPKRYLSLGAASPGTFPH